MQLIATYKMRRVKQDRHGNFRPVSKRAKWYVTDDNRMVVDGVYMLPGRGNEFYKVEAKYGGEPVNDPLCYRKYPWR